MSGADGAGAGPGGGTPTLTDVANFRALHAAARGARRGKHLSRVSARFFVDLETELFALERALRAGTWRPGPFRSFVVADPKPRVISAAPFADRVVHHALSAVVGPRFEAVASEASFACRVGRGTIAALARAREAVGRGGFFVKLDVRRYFETIDHRRLMTDVAAVVADPGLRALLGCIVAAGAPGSEPGRGLPIGNLTSQHLANFYLTGFDHEMKDAFPEVSYLRYMDDLLFVARTRDEARAVEALATARLEGPLRLAVKGEATRRGPVESGVPFLGFRIWPGHIRLDRHRKRRLGRRLRAIEEDLAETGDEGRAAMRAGSLLGWAALGDARPLVASLLARREAERATTHVRGGP
jgi:RNA-directed DNA polymerase